MILVYEKKLINEYYKYATSADNLFNIITKENELTYENSNELVKDIIDTKLLVATYKFSLNYSKKNNTNVLFQFEETEDYLFELDNDEFAFEIENIEDFQTETDLKNLLNTTKKTLNKLIGMYMFYFIKQKAASAISRTKDGAIPLSKYSKILYYLEDSEIILSFEEEGEK